MENAIDVIYSRAVELRDMGFLRRMLWNDGTRRRDAAALFLAAGNGYLSLKSYDNAITSYTECIELYNTLDEYLQIAHTSYTLATVYLQLDRTDEYISSLQKSIRLYDDLNNKCAVPLLIELASYHEHHTSYVDAVAKYSEAADISRMAGDTALMDICYTKISELSLRLEEYEDAIDAYIHLSILHTANQSAKDRYFVKIVLCHLVGGNYLDAHNKAKDILDKKLSNVLLDLIRSVESGRSTPFPSFVAISAFSDISNSLDRHITIDGIETLLLLRIKSEMGRIPSSQLP